MKMRRIILMQLWILFSVFILSVANSWSEESVNFQPDIKPLIQKGDEALQEITETNCQKAITEYEAALRVDPENYEANWKMSKAYCLILDLKTAGLIEEKEEYKSLLKDFGAKAEHYAAQAYAQNPKGLDVLIWYNSSYGYHASSLGILQAIMKGAGGKLKKLANELIALDDGASDALGYRMLGRFHLNAPFPVGKKSKAVQYLKDAVRKAPNSLFNHYWLGQAYLEKEKTGEAENEFQFAMDHPPSPAEKHFSGPIKEAAQKRLQELTA